MRRCRTPGQLVMHPAEDRRRIGRAAELDGEQGIDAERAFDGQGQLARGELADLLNGE